MLEYSLIYSIAMTRELITPQELQASYFQQGYNLKDSIDGTLLGGGCQAASLLMLLRSALASPNLFMNSIASSAKELGFSFHDEKFSTRISYPAVAAIAAAMLPNYQVTLLHKSSRENIASDTDNRFFHRESREKYLAMPELENLRIDFAVSEEEQIKRMIEALRNEAFVLPLFQSNILYASNSEATKNFWHAVLLYDYNESNTFQVLDPNPGFTRIADFEKKKERGLKIRAGLWGYEQAQSFAKKFHPFGDIAYDLSLEKFKKAFRGFSTIVTPKKFI